MSDTSIRRVDGSKQPPMPPRNTLTGPDDGIDYNNLLDHPLAADFDLLKENSEEFKSLVASIRERGFRTELGKIMLFEGKILDGRNRYRACKAAGHKFTGAEFGFFSGDGAEEYVSAAQARRNITMDDKKAYAKKLIARHPEWDIRKIGKMAGISKSVVAELKKPEEDTTFKKLEKAWLDASDDAQVKFANQYKVDITGLLAS